MSDQIVDYARPLINIEFMQRVIHDACIRRDYENARKITLELATEARLLAHTLALMEEEVNKRNKR